MDSLGEEGRMRTRSVLTGFALIAGALFVVFQGVPLEAQSSGTRAAASQVVEIIAEDYALSAPDAIPSGWTTFRLRNQGEEPHFVLISRLPEGKTIDDYEVDLSAHFNRAWVSVRDGEKTEEEAMGELFAALPEWFPELVFEGGPGMTAAGRESGLTMNLEPGNYVLECYLKTPDGEFHYMEGMIRPMTVTADRSGVEPPRPDIRITLSNFEMTVEGQLTPGPHIARIDLLENPEEGFGHNVHVARLDADSDIDEIVEWMDAFDLDGLRPPAPATFIGGAQIMPAGRTVYLPLNLEPGRYLFISEYTGNQGVLKEVRVER
jgi:hypothetical protein